MNHPPGERIDGGSMAEAQMISTDEIAVMPRQEDKPDSTTEAGTISDSIIAKRAYELWLDRGCPEGSPEVDWYEAQSEMKRGGVQSSTSVFHATGATSLEPTDPGD